jgi:nitroreductase
MSGIVFLGTKDLDAVREFYAGRAGMDVWLEQAECAIYSHGNMLLGFCTRESVDRSGVLTFFYPGRADVDAMYEKLGDIALDPPKVNDRYRIYNFYARDPEERTVEFQAFLHPTAPHLRVDEALGTRRSVRKYTGEPVPDELLWKVMEDCRRAPTSMNSESYYYVVIRDREKREFIAGLRGPNSAPIAASPIAVAICSDSGKTKRPEQDGCIGAYHFLLAAHAHGLGTCWIAAMDRDDAKDALGIPKDHYVATVTPLGFPAERPAAHQKRAARDMVRFVD